MMIGLSALPMLAKKFWVRAQGGDGAGVDDVGGQAPDGDDGEGRGGVGDRHQHQRLPGLGATAARAITEQTSMPPTRQVLRALFSDQPRLSR